MDFLQVFMHNSMVSRPQASLKSRSNLEAGAAVGFGAASVGEEKVSAVQPYSTVPNQL